MHLLARYSFFRFMKSKDFQWQSVNYSRLHFRKHATPWNPYQKEFEGQSAT
jgi:hypothetical protein